MNIFRFTLGALGILLLTCGCGKPPSKLTAGLPPALAQDTQAMADEKAPDFSAPMVEDKTLQVPGMPEDLVWYTSKPGVWGSPRAVPGGTYRMYMEEFPATFRGVGPNSNHAYRDVINNGLSLLDLSYETKEFIPSLATHWAFGKDGKTVYFRINPLAKWSDGVPVTSGDFEFMWQMFLSPNIQDPYYNETYKTQYEKIQGIGPSVVAITANVPMSKEDLLLNTNNGPKPKHFYPEGIPKDYVDSYQWKVEPTTNAYRVSDFKKGESLTLTKVKDWWGYTYDYNRYRFNIETLEYRVITGGNDVVKNYFAKGELDDFPAIIPSLWSETPNMPEVKQGYVYRLSHHYVPLTGVSGIFFNFKDPLLGQKLVRKALTYGINIQKMIDVVLRGEYARFHNIGLAHTFAGYDFDDNTLRFPDFDPVKAGTLLAEAGFDQIGDDGIRKNAKGDRMAFELLYQTPNHTERLSLLKEEAKKAGIEINLKIMQTGAFTAFREKKYQAFWGGMSTSLYPDYWQYFHSKNADKPQTNNFWSYSNPAMDKLLDAFQNESSLAKKAEIDKEIQRIAHEDVLVLPNYYVPFYRGLAWRWVRFPGWLGMKYSDDIFAAVPGNSGYSGYMWIDPKIQAEVQDAMKKGQPLPPQTISIETHKAK